MKTRKRCSSFCSSATRPFAHFQIAKPSGTKDDRHLGTPREHRISACHLKPAISLQNMTDDEELATLKLQARMRTLEETDRKLHGWISRTGLRRNSRILSIADPETHMLCFLEPIISAHRTADGALDAIKTTLWDISRDFPGRKYGRRKESISTVSSTTLDSTSSTRSDEAKLDSEDFYFSPRRKLAKAAFARATAALARTTDVVATKEVAVVKSNRSLCVIL